MSKVATVILVITGVVVTLKMMGGSGPSDPSKPPKTAQEEACASDWQQCTDNHQLINTYQYMWRLEAACKNEARRQARYGSPTFPWVYSFWRFTFDSLDSMVKTGIAIANEPEAQFQNQYGAMEHVTVTCRYDLRTNKVLKIDITPN